MLGARFQCAMLDVGSTFAKKATAGQVFDVLFSSRKHERTKPRKIPLERVLRPPVSGFRLPSPGFDRDKSLGYFAFRFPSIYSLLLTDF